MKSWPSDTAPRWPPVGTWVMLVDRHGESVLVFGTSDICIGPYTGLDFMDRPCVACAADAYREMGWDSSLGYRLVAVPAEEAARLQLGTLDGL